MNFNSFGNTPKPDKHSSEMRNLMMRAMNIIEPPSSFARRGPYRERAMAEVGDHAILTMLETALLRSKS